MEFELSPTKKQLACFLGGGSRRLLYEYISCSLAIHSKAGGSAEVQPLKKQQSTSCLTVIIFDNSCIMYSS